MAQCNYYVLFLLTSQYLNLQIDRWTWYYILAAELTSSYSMSASELPPSHSLFPATLAIAFQYSLNKTVTKMTEFGSNMKLEVAECGKSDFQYWVIAPYFPNGIALLGELNKVTTVSETRFGHPVINGNEVTIMVNGVPKETVSVTFYDGSKDSTIEVLCPINDSGTNRLHVSGDVGSCA